VTSAAQREKKLTDPGAMSLTMIVGSHRNSLTLKQNLKRQNLFVGWPDQRSGPLTCFARGGLSPRECHVEVKRHKVTIASTFGRSGKPIWTGGQNG
jgi:hypothetical protein